MKGERGRGERKDGGREKGKMGGGSKRKIRRGGGKGADEKQCISLKLPITFSTNS